MIPDWKEQLKRLERVYGDISFPAHPPKTLVVHGVLSYPPRIELQVTFTETPRAEDLRPRGSLLSNEQMAVAARYLQKVADQENIEPLLVECREDAWMGMGEVRYTIKLRKERHADE
jgi:hypothetical protein